MNFKDLNLKTELNDAIENAGFKEPSPVQKEAIPIVLSGKDLVAQAHTGTGKTVAFGLPILEQLKCNGDVEALVIVPTRELAMQVSDELFRFGKFINAKTATVYGGTSYTRQITHIKNASIIVATPGRLLDLLKSKKIVINPSFVVLDEADEMLDMGFLDEIKKIFKYISDDRQTLMFSATMPEAIKRLAKEILKDPEFVSLVSGERTNINIKQNYYVVEEYERDDALIRLFDYKNPTKSIVFCKTKKDVDRLATFLISQGFIAKALHGDMEQRQREEVMKAFKSSTIEVLVATDVAARGLDVSDVTHVFNFHLPYDSESYVHRIGRTGRAGKEGLAISIVTPREFGQLKRIQRDTKTDMQTQVIPTIVDVKNKKASSLIEKIEETDINENTYDLIEHLKGQFDVSTICHKLASLLIEQDKVSGKNKIGKSLKDIEFLIQRNHNTNNSRSRNRRRGNGGGRGSRGQGRGRSSGGGGQRGGNRGGNRGR